MARLLLEKALSGAGLAGRNSGATFGLASILRSARLSALLFSTDWLMGFYFWNLYYEMAGAFIYRLFYNNRFGNLGRGILSYAGFRFINGSRRTLWRRDINTTAARRLDLDKGAGPHSLGPARHCRKTHCSTAEQGANANHSYYHLLSHSHLDLPPFIKCSPAPKCKSEVVIKCPAPKCANEVVFKWSARVCQVLFRGFLQLVWFWRGPLSP